MSPAHTSICPRFHRSRWIFPRAGSSIGFGCKTRFSTPEQFVNPFLNESGVSGRQWRQSILVWRILPLRINLRLELAATDQFLKIANDGAARDAELAGQRRDVRALARLADEVKYVILPAEPVG